MCSVSDAGTADSGFVVYVVGADHADADVPTVETRVTAEVYANRSLTKVTEDSACGIRINQRSCDALMQWMLRP